MSTPPEQVPPPMTQKEAAKERQRTLLSALLVFSVATFGFWKWLRPGEETWAWLVGGLWASVYAKWAFEKFLGAKFR